jgi:HSP20 family molecular chaperone IbpA
MTAFMSPIERWPDDIYAPEKLKYVCNQTSQFFEIVAPLHEYDADDVRVDLSRGQVIILLSREYGETSNSWKEYYCEVPIPADTKRNKAYVEISPGILTVRLTKKWRWFKRMGSLAQCLKKVFTKRFGQDWNLNSLDA